MAQITWTRRGLVTGGAAILVGGGAYALKGRSGLAMNFSNADSHTLFRGNGAEPDTLDPHKASGSWENNIIGDMFLGLMSDGPNAEAVPGAAESFTVSSDGLVYTFKLREHYWSDGTPVSASDFVYSYRRVANPRTAAQYASILYPLRNVEAAAAGRVSPEEVGARAIDERTLELSFRFQVPYIRDLLTHYTSFAVPQHVVEKHGENWTRPENIVVNGPYTLKRWLPNDHIRLERNPRYFGRHRLAIHTVYFYPTQDSSAALKRFRAGEFDIVSDSVPPQQINWLKLYLPHALRRSPFISSQYVVFNLKRKPFDDVRVRLALSLAIDREILVSKVMRAGERAAYAFVPPGMPGYRGGELSFRLQTMPQRLARAKALLAAAGYGGGHRLSFQFNTSNTTESRLISIALQGMWHDVGVAAQLTSYDSQINYNLLRKHDFDVAWAGWSADYRDPKNYLTLLQVSAPDLNYGSYANPRFEALVESSDIERDPAKRGQLLRQAEQLALDDVAIAPIYFGVTRNLVSSQVKGWTDNNVNIHRTRYLSLDRADRSV